MFDSSVLPKMLLSIEMFRETFPHAQFQVERYLSFMIAPRKASKRRSPEELKEERRREFVGDVESNRAQLAALEELLPTIGVKEIKIINDSDETFDFEIYLQPNQKDRLKKLWDLARMAIPTCSAEATGYCHWGASMVSFGSEWIYLEFCMALLKKFSKNIFPDDTPIRALEMWRNFVAKHAPAA
jgi:hypothetical protein